MPPPPGHEPFLRAICEAPDDDAPRLVFADWLDETGDADRAEFVRKHIQLARDPEAPSLEARCQELFRQNWARWVAELPDTAILWAKLAMPSIGYMPLLFDSDDQPARMGDTWEENLPSLGDWHHGFPATVYIQGHIAPFLSAAHHIADFVPVRRVCLHGLDDVDAAIRALTGTPLLSKVRELSVKEMYPSDHAAIFLASSRHATGLRFVSLSAVRMSDRAAAAFAESQYLGGLEMLHLTHNSFSDTARDRLRARFGFAVHC